MDSPQPHKIFLVTEILEMILLQTDMQTLLISAQRVCQKWHALIQDSYDLQVALFLKPMKSTSPRVMLMKAVANPLIDKAIQPWLQERYRRFLEAVRTDETQRVPEIYSILEKDEIFMRDEASWHRMFSHQPPKLYAGIAVENLRAWYISNKHFLDLSDSEDASTLLASTSEGPRWNLLSSSRRSFNRNKGIYVPCICYTLVLAIGLVVISHLRDSQSSPPSY